MADTVTGLVNAVGNTVGGMITPTPIAGGQTAIINNTGAGTLINPGGAIKPPPPARIITVTGQPAASLFTPVDSPLVVAKGLTVADTGTSADNEVLTVKIVSTSTPTLFGKLSDPTGKGNYDTFAHQFNETDSAGTDPTFATNLFNRLIYTPDPVDPGHGYEVKINAIVAGGTTTDTTPITIDVVTPPLISGSVANQPVASGSAINPFKPITITDEDFLKTAQDSATITITDNGIPTDDDGLLTGTGLSKVGVGTYTLGASSPDQLTASLAALSFAALNTSFRNHTPAFELDVTDTKAKLTAKDTGTNLVIPAGHNANIPSIDGIIAVQTVTPGASLAPFGTVSIGDTNLPDPMDSAKISVPDASGTLTGTGLTHDAGSGIYTLPFTDPGTLTKELEALKYTPAPLANGQTSATSNLELDITEIGGSFISATTAVTETALPKPPIGVDPQGPPNNFLVTDQTTGQTYQSQGEAYTGPVQGLDRDIILLGNDNLNVTAGIKNVFIKTGGGEDAIDVSKTGGTNVLDGGTGSSFFVGGAGLDTFFADNRSAKVDTWPTISNFHSGDDATVFGVTPQDFKFQFVDGQGAAGFTGLTLHATAANKPTASLTLVGYSMADLNNGKLAITFGTEPDGSGTFMLIHAN